VKRSFKFFRLSNGLACPFLHSPPPDVLFLCSLFSFILLNLLPFLLLPPVTCFLPFRLKSFLYLKFFLSVCFSQFFPPVSLLCMPLFLLFFSFPPLSRSFSAFWLGASVCLKFPVPRNFPYLFLPASNPFNFGDRNSPPRSLSNFPLPTECTT